jgi:hypothetical protein
VLNPGQRIDRRPPGRSDVDRSRVLTMQVEVAAVVPEPLDPAAGRRNRR